MQLGLDVAEKNDEVEFQVDRDSVGKFVQLRHASFLSYMEDLKSISQQNC